MKRKSEGDDAASDEYDAEPVNNAGKGFGGCSAMARKKNKSN